MKKNSSFGDNIVEAMFTVSKKPVLFRDLLEANALYNEKMLVDPAKLNFNFRYGQSYIIFGVLCVIALGVVILISHNLLSHLDVHFSIISTFILTSAIFICFDIFKAWARRKLTLKLIKNAWSEHFPYFSYEKYSLKVEKIYDEALKEEIPRSKLEQYVIDKLVKSS